MSIIYVLLPLSLFLALIGLLGYLWSVRSGQWDDLTTPSMRILGEDESRKSSTKVINNAESPDSKSLAKNGGRNP